MLQNINLFVAKEFRVFDKSGYQVEKVEKRKMWTLMKYSVDEEEKDNVKGSLDSKSSV